MNSNPVSDQAGLQALREGRDSALDELIARWQRPLFAFAWRYVQNSTDAHDLVAETFVRLHQQRDRLRADTKLSAWLFTTLSNLCHNHYRWRRRHPTVSLDDPIADTDASPHDTIPSDCAEPNAALEREIEPCLERPEEPEPWHPVVTYHDFAYQAGTWDRPRRVVSKIEWHAGELFPRVGFIVTNRTDPARGIVRFYNGRGTCEQWIKAGKHALEWMRLSCHEFKNNVVRLALFVLAYNLGNFLRRLVLPPEMARWSLTTLREKLVKIGARLTRHARRLVLQLAEVTVTRDLFAQILSRIRHLKLVPI